MKTKIIYLLMAIIALSACTTDINLNLDGTSPRLIVDGAISTDTLSHHIYLKTTADYFSNKALPGIKGAIVTLSDGSNSIQLTESKDTAGLYSTPSNYYGVAGKTYSLKIKNIDVDGDGVYEEYESSSVLNTVTNLDSISVEETTFFGTKMWALKASFQEIKAEKNYFLFRNYRNGKCVSDTLTECGCTADEYFNGTYLNNETVMFFSSKKADEEVHNGDLITLEMCGITKDYYNFVNELSSEAQGHNPLFGGQPSNISTNIKQTSPANVDNKPCGFFVAYSIKRKSVIYQQPQ